MCVCTHFRIRVLYTCTHATARFAGRARLRLSSANEFRFSAAAGCHVKLHRGASFFRSRCRVCIHVAPLRRACERGDTRVSGREELSSPRVYPRALAQLSREIVSSVCRPRVFACESLVKSASFANPAADRMACCVPHVRNARGGGRRELSSSRGTRARKDRGVTVGMDLTAGGKYLTRIRGGTA